MDCIKVGNNQEEMKKHNQNKHRPLREQEEGSNKCLNCKAKNRKTNKQAILRISKSLCNEGGPFPDGSKVDEF